MLVGSSFYARIQTQIGSKLQRLKQCRRYWGGGRVRGAVPPITVYSNYCIWNIT